MSRFEHKNDSYMVAYGIDQTPIGPYPFVQVWCQPVDEQDGAIVVVDVLGVHVEEGVLLPTPLVEIVKELVARFETAKRMGLSHPRIDYTIVNRIAASVGLTIESYSDLD